MPLGKLNLFGNQQTLPQRNQNIQPLIASRQSWENNYSPLLGRGLRKFLPLIGGQGNLPVPPGLARILNSYQAQSFGRQQLQYPLAPPQSFPGQGYYPQQGNDPQKPIQPAWEQPQKGGIKDFFSNLMARRKK